RDTKYQPTNKNIYRRSMPENYNNYPRPSKRIIEPAKRKSTTMECAVQKTIEDRFNYLEQAN
ncbi:45240_t:CDS:1, partial [Gigaspora margarita]